MSVYLNFSFLFSFGFSDKVTMNGHVPVGLYGNGFKSGSMRLGKDAIVFTKNGETMSVGFLSQTYLEVIKAEHVVVPIVTFNKHHILFILESMLQRNFKKIWNISFIFLNSCLALSFVLERVPLC